MASLLKDGLARRDGRKTARQHIRRSLAEMPDWRVTMLLPSVYLVSEGRTGIAGVFVEPDPISGPLAVVTAKGLEWCLTQLGKFLAAVAPASDDIRTVLIARGDYRRGQPVVISPDSVEFPQRGGTTIKVER
jgi:hypothetical protein